MARFRSVAAMLAGLGTLLLAPAAAQAADYQVYKDGVCTPNSECVINFGTVPAGKRLLITSLSCYLRHFDGLSVSAAQLVLQNTNSNFSRAFAVTPNLHLQSEVTIGSDTQLVWVSNDAIRAVARPSQRFQAYAQLRNGISGNIGTVQQFSCGISGTIN